MKKYILLITIIVFSKNLQSQTWCPSGATWHYGFQGVWSDGYYKYTYVGDTLLASTLCKKIEKKIVWYNFWAFNYDTTILGFEYTYADTNKVFLWRFNSFNTLYDFSAVVGDTLLVPGTNQYVGCDSTGLVKVDSVGTIIINSQSLRYYSVSSLSGSKWGWNCRIVEKIGPLYNYPGGSESYFLPVNLDGCGMMIDEEREGGSFRCYEDDSFATFSVISQTCDYTLDHNELTENKIDFNIFPNPTSGNFKINFDNPLQNSSIKITNSLGETIIKKETSFLNEVQINISNQPKGIYFVSIITDKYFITKKLIKE